MIYSTRSCSVLVATDRSSWIPTASAVRYYTEIQSCLAAAVFPSILSDDLVRLLLSLCYGGSKIDTRHSLVLAFLLLFNFDLRDPLTNTDISLLSSSTALLLGLMYGAPANRLNRLQTLWLYTFLLMSNSAARFLLLSIVSNMTNR